MKAVTKTKPVKIPVDKRIARCVYDTLHNPLTRNSHQIHEVIANLYMVLRLEELKVHHFKWSACIESAIKIGHFAHLNGRPNINLIFPDGMNRRWKLVTLCALATGIQIARNPIT